MSMQSGGIKESSHTTYTANFLEYWRTMRRLGIKDELTFLFPTPDILLRVYIVDCARIRKKPNVWGTIRNKLRSIDYYAQLTGCIQSWSENPSIAAQIRFCKKNNLSSIASTLPVTAERLYALVIHVLNSRVYCGLRLTRAQQRLRDNCLLWDAIWQVRICPIIEIGSYCDRLRWEYPRESFDSLLCQFLA
eukprot:237459_1